MAAITVWTKQHESVLDTLERTGRYTVKRAFIEAELREDAPLVLAVYDWLVANGPDAGRRPAEGAYPVWVSFRRETAMLPEPGRVLLELEVEESTVTRVNIAKWGAMLNYAYLPADAADGRRHQRETERRGISDTEACLSRFYPELKAEIQQSWHRLFDPAVRLGSDEDYGNLWEIRREWIRNVIR